MKYKQLKHLRTFELNKPQIGDYVIMSSGSNSYEIKNFIENNIGRIADISYDRYYLYVRYENVPITIKNIFGRARQFNESNVVHISKNEEDLKAIIAQNKYNL